MVLWEEIAFDYDSFYSVGFPIDFYIELLLSISFNHKPYLWDPRPWHIIISCLLKSDMIFIRKLESMNHNFCPYQRLNEHITYRIMFLPHYEAYILSNKMDFFFSLWWLLFAGKLHWFYPNLVVCQIRLLNVMNSSAFLMKKWNIKCRIYSWELSRGGTHILAWNPTLWVSL